LSDAVDAVREGEQTTTPFYYDTCIELDQCRRSLFEAIRSVAPFGQGNPAPILLSTQVRARPKALRGGHLKMFIDGPDGPIEGLAWNMLDRQDWLAEPIDILYTPDIEVWRGREKLVFRIQDFRPSVVNS
jgi:single-stranded-DNA-specific exonuclease